MARILVIDDNDKFRDMLRECLENEGYKVVTASDGKKGLDLYRKEPADLIITDLLMPEKDGMGIIVDLNREFSDAKIIVISGGGEEEDSAESYLEATKVICNIKYTFSKPLVIDEMLKTVKEVLDG